MTEYVECKDCKCWNTEHFYFQKLKEKKEGIGICQRKAQSIDHWPKYHYYYLMIFHKLIDTGLCCVSSGTKDLPLTQENEGCWEGIKKDG